jgi:hypothetical protein
MRLEEIVKYQFVKKHHRVSFSLLLIFFCINIYAQKYQIHFKDATLSGALLEISEKFDIKVAFDAGKLGQISVNREVSGNTTDELIVDLLQNSGYGFQYKHGRYLIIPRNELPDDMPFNECQIQGTVMDNETGEILPYATISLNNQNLICTASEGGTFSIKNIIVNPIHLRISFIGFYTLDTVLFRTNSIMNCNFKLSRKTQIIDSVLVKGIKVEMVDFRNDVDFATTINPMKLTDLPVVVEPDIFKTLQLLPGISYTSNSSELSIRGGSSDQNLILFDGQTLYNLSHYYGVVSSINPNVVKDIQVYKGGFDSRYGERVSGIVDIQGKSGNQLKPSVYGDMNMVCGNITAEIPIGNKLSVVAAYRRSYSDIYNTSLSNYLSNNKPNSFQGENPGLVYQTTPTFYFYDYNTKLTYRINEKENISVSIFGSKDFFDNSYNGNTDSLKINTTDKNNWSSYGYSASWLKQWNETFFSNLQVGTSGYTNDYVNNTSVVKILPTTGAQQYLPNDTNNFNSYNKNDLTDFSLSLRNSCYINNRNYLNFGMIARRNSIYYHKDADMVYVYDNTDESSWITSLYAQDRILIGSRFTLKPGFRLNYYNSASNFYFEPRLAVNYRFSDKFSVRMATGRYYQFISQVLSQQETGYNKNFWVLTNDSLHPVLKSTHLIFGSTIEAGKFLFDAEVYYKKFSGLQEYIFISSFYKNSDFHDLFPQRNQDRPIPGSVTSLSTLGASATTLASTQSQAQPSYFINGNGKSYGVDFFVRYKSGNFTSWISYSISKSVHRFPDINYNAEIPAPADQTHQLSWTNMLTLGKWNLGSTTLFSTGRPYVDYTESRQDLPITRNYKRLPNYSRSDISFNYNFMVGFLRLKAGATIVNIFNTQNYFDVNTRKFDFENTSFAETNLIRSQELSLNFFLRFSL